MNYNFIKLPEMVTKHKCGDSFITVKHKFYQIWGLDKFLKPDTIIDIGFINDKKEILEKVKEKLEVFGIEWAYSDHLIEVNFTYKLGGAEERDKIYILKRFFDLKLSNDEAKNILI